MMLYETAIEEPVEATALQFEIRNIRNATTQNTAENSDSQTVASLEGQGFAISAGAATTTIILAQLLGFFG